MVVWKGVAMAFALLPWYIDNRFMKENEHRLNLGLLHRFWTSGALNSEAAMRAWLTP
jgi:hypothetical protein